MQINYDKYSLIINNERILIKSAALHYFRTPGRKAWYDRLSKLKACGYNTVDLYFCWGYHSNKRGHYDFTDIKDIRTLLDITNELGMFVVARPGPYINAEVSLGGLPKWILNIPNIHLRNREDGNFVYSENYMKLLKEWYARIIPILNEYHNIIAFQIENEYYTNEAEPDYLQELYEIARDMGIKAPIFHNDALACGLYADIVNIYGFDTYPTINMNYDWKDFPDSFGVLDNAEENLADACENSPLYIAELQAGWFDKWNGTGYDKVKQYFQKEHINIVTKTALSQGITMFNHYMGCGGTSWGDLASSEVYTSYDFAAPISEYGIPGNNYYKSKEINTFLNSFNLASTGLVNNDISFLKQQEKNILAITRKDNINNCRWLFIRNLNKISKKYTTEDKQPLTVKPFDMKILPIDLQLKACKIVFSGLSLFGKIENDNEEKLFVILEPNNYIKLSNFDSFHANFEIKSSDSELIVNSDNIADFASICFKKDKKSTEIIFINEETADKTWLIDKKAIIGPDFLTENSTKAAYSKNTTLQVIELGNSKKQNDIETDKAASIKEIALKNWQVVNCGAEIDSGYDYSNWNYIEENKPDCISNGVYDDYIWYKGSFQEQISNIKITAKHCYAVYINGKQVYSHDSFCFEEGCELTETTNFKIDPSILNNQGKNEITVLVQNMGFDKGFSNELTLTRGIIAIKTLPERPIEWQIRGGLLPVRDEWNYIPTEELDNQIENNYLKYISLNFSVKENNNIYSPLSLDINEVPFCKADIYLNGYKIGHYWKNKGPQTSYYLPECFLKEQNTLALIVWDRENSILPLQDFNSIQKYVNIKIRNIKAYTLQTVE